MKDDLFAVIAGLAAIWFVGKVVKQPERPKKPRRVTVYLTPAKFLPFINFHAEPETIQ